MSRTVKLIGAPTNYGGFDGPDLAPAAIRYAGLTDRLENTAVPVSDAGDLDLVNTEPAITDVPDELSAAKNLPEISGTTARIADAVSEAIAAGDCPLVLGGDHTVSMGTLRGAAAQSDIGLLWFDAHADLNTPSSSVNGNVHGMALGAALGIDEFATAPWAHAAGLREENVAIIGLREVTAPHEPTIIENSEMSVYRMSDIESRGMQTVLEEAFDVATAGVDGIHVSFDVDWLDPDVCPGVRWPVDDGATAREARLAMEYLSDHREVIQSADFVEVTPTNDHDNCTAEMAAECISVLLGKAYVEMW